MPLVTPAIRRFTPIYAPLQIELTFVTSQTRTITTPPPVARGKLFAVAPMMDGEDKPKKSGSYEAACAERVQQETESAGNLRDQAVL
jgi:hypothetical protein